MTKYHNDPDFKLRVKKLAALAFLPLADVIDAFEVLADTFEDDELPLLGYLDWCNCGAQIRAADCTYLPSCHVERPRASLHGYDSDHQRSRGIPSRLKLPAQLQTSNYLGTPEGSSSPTSPY